MKLWRASRGFDNAVDRQFAKELQGLAALGEAAIIKKGVGAPPFEFTVNTNADGITVVWLEAVPQPAVWLSCCAEAAAAADGGCVCKVDRKPTY